MPFHPLTNFEIKDGVYIINLDECSDTGTHGIALYVVSNNDVAYFDSFEVESIFHKKI